MIIDAHAHVYLNPRITFVPGGTPFMSVEQQLKIMDKMGIEKAVILPIINPDCGTEMQGINEILEICEKNPGRFIPFCNIDCRLKGSSFYNADAAHFEFLLNQYKALGCKGLGEICSKIPFDDPVLWELFAACEKIGFSVTFHASVPGSNDYGLVDEIGFPRFEKTLQKFPNLKFFCHSQSWWAEMSTPVTAEEKNRYPEGPVNPGGTVPRLMGQYPQVYGDLSANSWINALKRDPQHAWKFIEQFQDRILFGLDYCSPLNERSHIEWLTQARDDGNISQEAYEKIMWKNIASILNLDV